MHEVATVKTNQAVHRDGFALQPASLKEAQELATMLGNSQMIPKQYQGKPADTLVAMMLGSELKLNPLQSLQNIAVINGRPALWGDSMQALVQNHHAFGGMTEAFNDATMTATCTVWRKGGEKHIAKFSKDDAQTAKLWGKQGPWTQYPKRMLQLRARGFALRDQFADALAGLISAEEAGDMPIDITPVQPDSGNNAPSLAGVLESIATAGTEAELNAVVGMAGQLAGAERNQARQAYSEKLEALRQPVEAEAAEPEQAITYYPDDQFQKNLPAWMKLIESGKRSADEIISTIASKAEPTPEQAETLRAIKADDPAVEGVVI